MIACFVVTLVISLSCAARFCAGDADDVAMNQQVKQCATAIKNELQTAITNGKDCTEILKDCKVVSSTTAVSLTKLRCGRLVPEREVTVQGSELSAKLTCPPGQHGEAEATSKELMQRLCFTAKLSSNTKNRDNDVVHPMLAANTPSSEFVAGLVAAANVDEVGPDVLRLAAFLGAENTETRRVCKKLKVTCLDSPAADQLKSKIEGDGCQWHTSKIVSRTEGDLWGKFGVRKDVKHTESVKVDLIDLARQFKVRNPTNRLAKIISLIDALHCGNVDKTMVGKKSFEDYAAALNKLASPQR